MSSSTDAGATLAEVRVPRETVNDDTVTIQSWHATSGARVAAGQAIVSIETSKAILEVEAGAGGYLDIIHAAGAEVPVGELIGRVLATEPPARGPRGEEPGGGAPDQSARTSPDGSAAPARSSNRLRDRRAQAESSAGTGRERSPSSAFPARAAGASVAASTTHSLPSGAHITQTVSRKAQRLLDEHGLSAAEVFPGRGLVRELDVIHHLEAVAADRMRADPMPPSPAMRPLTDPAPRDAAAAVNSAYPARRRGLMGDAAASARDRGDRSIIWLGWNYIWRNWLLGNLVRWAPRGVILLIHRMRGIKMGQDVFIDPTAIMETAFPENITIGNDVRVTAGCVVMTHIKAPHYLRETGLVPVVLKPVVLEDHCFIGVNSVVMPGVTVGKASVVASGSVVVANVPPYTMVQGNPARVIKQFPRPE